MDELYADDPTHPIPYVATVDAQVDTDAGVYVGLVIASPLQNDVRSIQRLTKKFENYLAHLESLRTQWRETYGSAMKVKFYVNIHPGSVSEAFSLIEQQRLIVEGQSIEFRLSTKNDAFGVH